MEERGDKTATIGEREDWPGQLRLARIALLSKTSSPSKGEEQAHTMIQLFQYWDSLYLPPSMCSLIKTHVFHIVIICHEYVVWPSSVSEGRTLFIYFSDNSTCGWDPKHQLLYWWDNGLVAGYAESIHSAAIDSRHNTYYCILYYKSTPRRASQEQRPNYRLLTSAVQCSLIVN